MDQTTTALFDPLGIEDVPSAECTIKDPTTGAPTTMVITLAGPEHPDRKRRMFARQRRVRAEIAQHQRLPVVDPEEEEADEIEELVACTLGWKGAPMPYSPETARDLYANPKRAWLRLQVRAFLDRREAFTRSSAAA